MVQKSVKKSLVQYFFKMVLNKKGRLLKAALFNTLDFFTGV
jgi:hypothetical protein